MKAVVITEFGDPSVLTVGEVDAPHPAEGQVRARVTAIGVNPLETVIRSGAWDGTLPRVLGFEFVGEVDEVGAGVDDVAPGTRIVGWVAGSLGSYAELALSDTYFTIPDGVADEEAVAVLTAAETASRVLALLAPRAGETLLVHGASGAVGSVAVQLAVAEGVTVVGTASPANAAYVESLGASVVEHGDGLVERVRAIAPQGIDAVFDAAGKGALRDSIELRGGTERIVTISDPEAQDLGIEFSAGSADNRAIGGTREALRRVAEGELRPRIAARLPLAEAAQAHRLLETGHPGGKVILLPGPSDPSSRTA